ncbi:MAG: NUDIX domain-containing protein [Rhizobiales bacterium]|nr:NUDIX domain-containing protein [Hyphomicrobiales bacterium]
MARSREVSAGLIAYRRRGREFEYLLAHPGGPYWAKKDLGAWTIPKGIVEDGDLLASAHREFTEETGLAVTGETLPLAPVQQKSGKIVHAFAVHADLDLGKFASMPFKLEWPPRSGRHAEFPEIDCIAYFTHVQALRKIINYQKPFLIELRRRLST